MTPERVAKLREVRRLLRRGWAVAAITKTLGIDGGQVANQRKLMTLVRDASVMSVAEATRSGRPRRSGSSKGRAEATGDLCDIIAANASRSDFRFGFTGRD